MQLLKFITERIGKIWKIQIVRFLFVGGINTVFGYSVYAIFTLLRIHYALALLAGHILGVTFNFFTTGRIVFKSRDNRLLFSFFGVYGITYLLNLGALRLFNHLEFNMLLAQLIMILPMAFLSYILNKMLVFKT